MIRDIFRLIALVVVTFIGFLGFALIIGEPVEGGPLDSFGMMVLSKIAGGVVCVICYILMRKIVGK